MNASISSSRINTVLLLVVGLLAGGIVGYLVGHSGAVRTTSTGALALQLNDILPEEDAWIVEGLTCPMAGCYNPLLVCQGELPRRIRDWVNAQRRAGRSGQEIRAEIISTHGANVQKLGSAPIDTLKTN